MEMIKGFVDCPYCGKKILADIGVNVWGTIVECYLDEDASLAQYGCQQRFVVRFTPTFESIKIDGFGVEQTPAGYSKPIGENLK